MAITIVVIGVAFFTTIILTPFATRFAFRFGMLDHPNNHSAHKEPKARSGGIAIFISFHLAILVLVNSPLRQFGALDLLQWWLNFFLTSSIILLVGMIDDFKRLSAPWKLCGQILAASVLYLVDVRIESVFGLALPEPLCFLVTVSWFIIVTNAFNLIDGIDGLAVGLTALASLGIAGSLIFREIYVEAVVLLGFIGSLLAFLKFNHYPAKIFLGDCGSNLCGFTLAYFMITTGSKHLAFAQHWVVLLVVSVPLIDTSLAIWRRSVAYILSRTLAEKEKPGVMTGDLEHIHHRLLRSGIGTRNVVASLYLVNSIFILISLISLPLPHYAVPILGALLLVITTIIIYLKPIKEASESALLIYHLIIKPHHPILGKLITSIIDITLLLSALTAALYICHPEYPTPELAGFLSKIGILWILTAFTISCTFISRKKICPRNSPYFQFAIIAGMIFFLIGNIIYILPIKTWQALALELSLFGLLATLFLLIKKVALSNIERYVELYYQRNN